MSEEQMNTLWLMSAQRMWEEMIEASWLDHVNQKLAEASWQDKHASNEARNGDL